MALVLAAPAATQAPFAGPGAPVVIGQGYDFPSRVLSDARRVSFMVPPGYGDPKQATTR